ncbi:hypothetical protein EBZ38_03755 [bacterium]|nr:hypothetical protein [bacterium]
MNAIISVILAVLPALRDYFTKNKGLNTVSGGLLGAFGVLAAQALQNQGTVDAVVTTLQNQGELGVIVGGVIVALRVFVAYMDANKK